MPFTWLFGFLRFFIFDFSLFKFICMDFSAWLRFLDSDFFHMAYYLLFFLFVASLPELRLFPGSRLLCFRDFSEGTSLFFLFRVRLYSFLIPHLNAFFLLMLTCGLIGFVVGAYRDAYSSQSLQKVRSSFIYTACEGNRQVPVSTLRQSRFIRFAEIPHADCPSNPNSLPPWRLFVFKVCFRFFRNLCVFRGLSLKEGIFLAFKSLFHRFFSFALSLSFFRFSFRKIVFYVITFHFSLNTPLLFSLFYRLLWTHGMDFYVFCRYIIL